MSVRLGDVAPDFEADTSTGPVRFHDWIGQSWAVLFSHPKDFTPVCTTELGAVAKLGPEFTKRHVKPIGLSVDPAASHARWIDDIEETQGAKVDYPIIADPERKVSLLYDMIHPNADLTHTVRTVFIIDPNKKVRLQLTYPQTAGRNFDEILRVIDSLQLTDRFAVSTPANWNKGQDVIVVPAVSTEDARKRFAKGVTEIKPYLRTTPDPSA